MSAADEQYGYKQPTEQSVESSEDIVFQNVGNCTAGLLINEVDFAAATSFRGLNLRKSVDRNLWALDILYEQRLGHRFRNIYLVNWLCVRQRGGGARRVFNNFQDYEGGRKPEKCKRPAAEYVGKPIHTEVYARNPGQKDHKDGA